MNLTAGTMVGPYRISGVLGSGGMGIVYEAVDTRLGRSVAIKYLNAVQSHRFQREATAIALLSHPQICTSYDIGPDYLVMERLQGATLAGPLPIPEAIRLGREIASALDAAHRRGIVHRDLKPANIMVIVGPDGVRHVKLLDFGLALINRGHVGAPIHTAVADTQSGMVVGTAGYMAPEQAVGREADERADIFAFGAVLYEIISGRRAFKGDTVPDTIAAVLHGAPDVTDIPLPIRQVVEGCLRKAPAERYPSMAAVATALDAASAGPGDQPRSIAVLPFADLNSDGATDYFSDGLADEIISALTHIPALKVTARTSSFAFRGKHQDVRAIATALGVRTVLEGSVRRAGPRIRVTAQLIDAQSGYHLWSERYDRNLTDIFAVQDEIAVALAGALQHEAFVEQGGGARYTPGLPAYEAFLRGRHHMYRQTTDSLPRAIACYEEAIQLDPHYPDPQVELAACEFLSWFHGIRSAPDVLPVVERRARIGLSHDRPHGGAMLGSVAAANYDWQEARRLLECGLEEQAGFAAEARWSYATFYLSVFGRFDEAVTLLQQTLDDDPLSVLWRTALADIYRKAGRYDVALRELAKGLDLETEYWPAHYVAAECHIAEGRIEEAMASAARAHALAPWHVRGQGLLAGLLARAGRSAEAEALLGPLCAPLAPCGASVGLLEYSLTVGDLASAARWYRQAIDERHAFVIHEAASTLTVSLRRTPAWDDLARMMRLPGAQSPTELISSPSATDVPATES